ncbi:MAG TPA: DNA mismatch repair endonuclease MutL [Leptospiraceae bacterium]|nr:DNA mismatch repair endonuclease MutL [Leptospiraceae bacterium]HNF15134.1 DNA mismatch repair endonuclease MutL [Leptospiraceae bacterium]HNI97337.1 DNA mismatch repair endonuclease MutL [Leptospiraceae bacterium]HNM05716.1 DNA mismatch repair endonuclease MutL [Leptospiraceae bacterium]HNN05503.1 DNA mismatch repair endonuclease MutL [Leptospiraceae bacterium]
MSKIHELSEDLINKIAAGEVIESPASVVKELIENSIDSGADEIYISSESGGLKKMIISDNGSGFDEDDISIAFQRHTTSKISSFRDLEKIRSYGFRGEALSSVAAVSRITLNTGVSSDQTSVTAEIEGSVLKKKEYSGPRRGSRLEVSDLFYNTPVRKKFLKSEKAEEKKIKDKVVSISLAKPEIRFQYIQNGREIFDLKKSDISGRIRQIFGDNTADHLMEAALEKRGISAFGFISDSEFYRSNRFGQYFFINGRPVELRQSSYLLKKAYDELLPPGAHPWCFIYFSIDPAFIDVNVHPAKKEIRFLDEEGFTGFFLELVRNVLYSKTPVGFLEMKRRMSSPIVPYSSQPSANAVQQKESFFQSILHENIFPEVSRQEGFATTDVGSGVRLETLSETGRSSRDFILKKHYGVIFGTFILAEAEDGLYIIDQHTAHERIRYEEILNSLKNKTYSSQILLSPIRIDLSIEEAESVLSLQKEFAQIGLSIEEFGEGTVIVRELPSYIEPGTEREVLLDFLQKFQENSFEVRNVYDLMAKCSACRTAVKKGDQVSDTILAELLNRLSYCENPSRCPHGRPTMIKLTRDDLEKMFHRK